MRRFRTGCAQVPKERSADKAKRACAILERLDQAMPEARIELDYGNPLQLLVAVMLSAQCTDKRVNAVTPALFERFPSVRHLAEATEAEVEPFIRTCGLFRAKARGIVATSRLLLERYGGEVPTSRELLAELPGVGRKTAGVVCIHLGGTPAFPVDTHIQRLARRMGLTTRTRPDDVEADLRSLLPERWWMKGHQLLIWHGRRVCAARGPACDGCVVRALCPRVGVSDVRAKVSAPRSSERSRAKP